MMEAKAGLSSVFWAKEMWQGMSQMHKYDSRQSKRQIPDSVSLWWYGFSDLGLSMHKVEPLITRTT